MSALAPRNRNTPDGLSISRLIKAMYYAKGDVCGASSFAEGQRAAWGDTPQVFMILRAAVSAVTQAGGSQIAAARGIFDEFLPVLRARSLLDRIAGFRRVPENVSVLRYTSDCTGAIVAEGAATPVSKFNMERVALAVQKIGALTVVTREVMENSSGLAELSLATELAKAIGAATDRAMFNVDVTGSIANSGTIIQSAGTSLANIDADLKLLLANFATGDAALDSAVFVTSPTTAAYLASLRGTGGANAFPSISARGGSLLGIPVFVSAALQGVGSPGNSQISLIDPAQILLADPGAAEVTTTSQASLQLDDASTQSSVTPTATNVVSLFETNSVGILGLRWANWLLSSAHGAVTLSGISY